MTDRELLVLAAKAVGINIRWQDWGNDRDSGYVYNVPWRGGFAVTKWNPLEDDGDALRLAVRLNLDIRGSMACGNMRYVTHGGSTYADLSTDHMEAQRGAIVRAAAEIGRGM